MAVEYFDYKFGLTEIVPSKQQDAKETNKVGAFKILVDKTITPQILKLPSFPTKKEVVVFALQFFKHQGEYEKRDVDNMGKTILDCLKGKLYIDDVQVRTLVISKKTSKRLPNNFVFVGVKILNGDTDIEVVQSKLMEQAIGMYNSSAKLS
jgi:Holliday junction resolvase RusA-like endonuclease